jgi:hypothetical protein
MQFSPLEQLRRKGKKPASRAVPERQDNIARINVKKEIMKEKEHARKQTHQ